VRKRTLFAFCAAALVAVIGVTAALAGSAGRSTPTAKPKPAKATSQSSGGVVESSTPTSDAADYWTEERMRSAGPLEKTVPGGSTSTAPSSQAPKSAGPASTAKAPNVTGAPATNGATPAKTEKQKQTKPNSGQAANDGGTVSADVTDDAAAYWTDEQMADAGPMEPEVAGGDGGGSQGSAGPGPVPGTP
jgi:hypothetical protein